MRVPDASSPPSWDFQVEHFVPKSKDPQRVFDWENLIGCCRGGTSGSHLGPHRASRGEAPTCGESKGDKEPGALLDPYGDLTPQQLLFHCHLDGRLVPHPGLPPSQKARAVESLNLLNLNDGRLSRLRKAVVDRLTDEVLLQTEAGVELEAAEENVFRSVALRFEPDGLVEFFSVHRSFFGQIAERCLREINYVVP